jgi:3-keto steroid reductase
MKETTVLPRPVVIVTGANGCVYYINSNHFSFPDRGVGYGICQRLLVQLCQGTPPDGCPQAFASEIASDEPTKPTRYSGVTLIMACRNMKRADAARKKLLEWFDEELKRLRREGKDEAYLRLFREGCNVQIAELDLANFASVLEFAATVHQMYVASCLPLTSECE